MGSNGGNSTSDFSFGDFFSANELSPKDINLKDLETKNNSQLVNDIQSHFGKTIKNLPEFLDEIIKALKGEKPSVSPKAFDFMKTNKSNTDVKSLLERFNMRNQKGTQI